MRFKDAKQFHEIIQFEEISNVKTTQKAEKNKM